MLTRIEREAGVKFDRRGAPQPGEVRAGAGAGGPAARGGRAGGEY